MHELLMGETRFESGIFFFKRNFSSDLIKALFMLAALHFVCSFHHILLGHHIAFV